LPCVRALFGILWRGKHGGTRVWRVSGRLGGWTYNVTCRAATSCSCVWTRDGRPAPAGGSRTPGGSSPAIYYPTFLPPTLHSVAAFRPSQDVLAFCRRTTCLARINSGRGGGKDVGCLLNIYIRTLFIVLDAGLRQDAHALISGTFITVSSFA